VLQIIKENVYILRHDCEKACPQIWNGYFVNVVFQNIFLFMFQWRIGRYLRSTCQPQKQLGDWEIPFVIIPTSKSYLSCCQCHKRLLEFIQNMIFCQCCLTHSSMTVRIFKQKHLYKCQLYGNINYFSS